jgi:hypothetical protein
MNIPFISLEANRTINALITNKNRPNVTMVSGIVSTIKNGRTNTFTIASTKENATAVQYVSI